MTDWPHEVIKQAAINGGYKRDSYKTRIAWTLGETALLDALDGWRDVESHVPPEFKAVLTQHKDDLYPVVAYWTGNCWQRETEGPEDSFYGGCRHEHLYRAPTHWQPLPLSPG